MKRIIFFLCIYAQTFALHAMEPKPQQPPHHSRTRSISDPSLLMNLANEKVEGARPQSPQQKLRQFALKNRFRYTGEYNRVGQQKTESES